MTMLRRFILLAALLTSATASYGSAGQDLSQVAPYPKVVIYTAPWCKSCNAAKEFFVTNNIPFVKKDVDGNDRYLEEMADRYKSRAVPVIVIGRDQKVLKGFVPELFQQAFREVLTASGK